MAKQLPKELQDALDLLAPEMSRAILEAFGRMRDAVSIAKVEAALIAGDVEAAIDALRIEGVWLSPVQQAIQAALIDGGAIALSGVRVKDPYDGTRFVLGFDGRHTRAEQWVRERSSELITEVVEGQQDMARTVIRAGLEAGRNPRTVALEIAGRVSPGTGKREGGFIGLTSQQAGWAQSAETELRNLDDGYFTRQRRDKRFDGTVRAAIKSGKPLAEADIRKIVTRYRDRLLKYRADVIGRTEALNAIRAGQHEGFAQLVESGKVRPDQVEVTWSATMDGRTRDHHRHLNGQTVRFGQFFAPAPGVFMRYPGDLEYSTDAKALASETIQCRCIASYRIKNDLLRD